MNLRKQITKEKAKLIEILVRQYAMYRWMKYNNETNYTDVFNLDVAHNSEQAEKLQSKITALEASNKNSKEITKLKIEKIEVDKLATKYVEYTKGKEKELQFKNGFEETLFEWRAVKKGTKYLLKQLRK